jgi:hypothetical protein
MSLSKMGRKCYILIGVIIAVATFFMMFFGVEKILGNKIDARNIMFYFGFSVMVGAFASAFMIFNFFIAFWIYCVSLVIGFFEMFRSFSNGMSGWGDLVGIISLLFILTIGFCAGIVAQVVWFIYKKIKNS